MKTADKFSLALSNRERLFCRLAEAEIRLETGEGSETGTAQNNPHEWPQLKRERKLITMSRSREAPFDPSAKGETQRQT
jgi:hypothetical protein